MPEKLCAPYVIFMVSRGTASIWKWAPSPKTLLKFKAESSGAGPSTEVYLCP
jgi:hypothetical protein